MLTATKSQFMHNIEDLLIFTEEGTMLTATKSQFMHNIEDLLPKRVTSVSDIDAVLFDATVVIQNQRKRVFQ